MHAGDEHVLCDGVDDWGEVGDVGLLLHPIKQEMGRVQRLPPSIRYRCFSPSTSSTHDIRSVERQSDFFVHRRRRLDYNVNDGSAISSSSESAMCSVLQQGLEVTQRQLETFHLLRTHKMRPEEIMSRFALDRKVGASPSLAATNCALRMWDAFGAESTEAGMELIEDVVLENGGQLPGSTFVEATRTLSVHAPARAARMALALYEYVRPGDRVSPTVWVQLGQRLTEASLSEPSPPPIYSEMFGRVLSHMRCPGHEQDPIDEAFVVAYGRCLLSLGNSHVEEAIQLVQQELLRGRNTSISGDAMKVHLGGFLSDLLSSLCFNESEGGQSRPKNEVSELVVFMGDVVKYSYARQLRLTPSTFDVVLAFCDVAGSYLHVCVLFASMCVLSTPTLLSLARTASLVRDASTSQPSVTLMSSIFRMEPLTLFVWCLQRPYLLASVKTSEDVAMVHQLCTDLGHMAGTTVDAEHFQQIMDAVKGLSEHRQTRTDWSASCAAAFLNQVRRDHSSSGGASSRAAALRPIDATCFLALTNCPVPTTLGSLPQQLEPALQQLLRSSEMYCNVLHPGVLSALARHPVAATAFVSMMQAYTRKGGAVVMMPTEALCGTFADGASKEGVELATSWLTDPSTQRWFCVLPPSLSVQLQGLEMLDLCCELFLCIRGVGHTRVALIVEDRAHSSTAREKSVETVIVLEDLLKRLKVSV